jgi:hypothetical protein
MAKPWQCFHYPFPVNGFYTRTIKVSLNHTLTISLYYSTHKVFKSLVKFHRPTSNSSSTTNFPWLNLTLQSNSVNCLVALNVFKITPRHGPRTENTCHMFAISPIHWRADCCPQKTHVTCQLPTVAVMSLHLRGSVFTEPLLGNGLHNSVFYCCVLDGV